MSLHDKDGLLELVGDCGLEDAEPLLARLIAEPGLLVDLRRCQSAHTAVVQVLLAANARTLGPAPGRFMHDVVEPLLNSG